MIETNIIPSGPVLRWHGGKWILAPWIISHFPHHRRYVEPYGGAASVLLRKPRSFAEVYNDLDDDVVNLFEVLRDDKAAARLIDQLELTPFARKVFDQSYQPQGTPVDQARALIVRSFMGYGSDGHNGAAPTGFRANSDRSGSTPASDWSRYPSRLVEIIARFKAVTVEKRPALEVMARNDSPTTLHYVDPPYLHATRSTAKNSTRKNYRHELTDDDHVLLLAFLRSLTGMVVLSGYPHEMYDRMLPAWHRVERRAMADGARERIECLWINPAAREALRAGPLFG